MQASDGVPPFPPLGMGVRLLMPGAQAERGGEQNGRDVRSLDALSIDPNCTFVATGGEQLLTECAFEERDSHPR